MTSVFFSYSHADEDLRNALEKQLAVLKHQGLIDVWHDRKIAVGEEVGPEIDRHLEAADIILLLLSPDFLASDYLYQREAIRALERHDAGTARVIPVILRPCDWQNTPFSKLLAAPRDGRPITRWPDQDEAFLDVVGAIRTALKEINGPQASPVQPSKDRAPVPELRSSPRSSNMRLAKTFTDHDKDSFVDQVFEYIAKYFESSLDELKQRNSGIETRFKQIDAYSFEASIYRDGTKRSSCGIWKGGSGRGASGFGGSIMYSSSGITQNSFNESLSVAFDDQKLFMKSLGISMMNRGENTKLTDGGAAELLWSILIKPLQ
jgi:TIR domain-containing protein